MNFQFRGEWERLLPTGNQPKAPQTLATLTFVAFVALATNQLRYVKFTGDTGELNWVAHYNETFYSDTFLQKRVLWK